MDFGDRASCQLTISVVNHEGGLTGALFNLHQCVALGILCSCVMVMSHLMYCSLLLQDAVERVAAARWDRRSEAAGRFRETPQAVTPRTMNPHARLLEGLCHAVHGHGLNILGGFGRVPAFFTVLLFQRPLHERERFHCACVECIKRMAAAWASRNGFSSEATHSCCNGTLFSATAASPQHPDHA